MVEISRSHSKLSEQKNVIYQLENLKLCLHSSKHGVAIYNSGKVFYSYYWDSYSITGSVYDSNKNQQNDVGNQEAEY